MQRVVRLSSKLYKTSSAMKSDDAIKPPKKKHHKRASCNSQLYAILLTKLLNKLLNWLQNHKLQHLFRVHASSQTMLNLDQTKFIVTVDIAFPPAPVRSAHTTALK